MSYIGQKEIKSIDNTVVTFTDDTTKTYTEKQLSYMVTDEPKDLSEERDLLLSNIIPEIISAVQKGDFDNENDIIIDILGILQNHNIRFGDFDSILANVFMKFDSIFKGVGSSFNQGFLESLGKAYGIYTEWEPATNFRDNIRVSDIIRLKD